MMRHRLVPVVAALLALAVRASSQDRSNEIIGRSGLDISGIEAARVAVPAAPAAKPSQRPKGPTEITAREATFDNQTRMAVFSFEVSVRDPEFGLSSDRLTVYLKKPPVTGAPKPEPKPEAKPKEHGDANSGIEKAIAEGKVVITQDKLGENGNPEHYAGKGKRAVFDNITGTLTLTGWPQISQSLGGNLSKEIISLEESCVIRLNRAGKIDVNGLHTSKLHDAGELNQNPR
jgi:lipopolysaccharide export system protein LptA